jgi:hypothetical protein
MENVDALKHLHDLAIALNAEKWVAHQTLPGYGERLTDETSGLPFSLIIPENGSVEDTVAEVFSGSRDDEEVAAYLAAVSPHNLAILLRTFERLATDAARYWWVRQQRITFHSDRIAPVRPDKFDLYVDSQRS